MRPRRLPRMKNKNNTNNQPQIGPNNTINNIPNQITNPNITNNISNNPNPLQPSNNISIHPQQDESDYIKKKGRFRDRHKEDYAINIAPNREDIMSEDTKLYDNRDINLEAPKIKENIGLDSTEFYIESIHHDQYYKINQIKKEEKKVEEEITGEKKIGAKKRKKTQKKLTAFEQAQAIEDKLYKKFDNKLTAIITRTLSKVTLIFLFAQGLLAGMGLLHILITLTYSNYEEFLHQLSQMVIIMFNIFHALTFISLVGNGIKFVSSYQKYKIMNLRINSNTSEFTRLRQNMIFSGILLVCFTVVFGFEVYLVTFVQRINLNKCLETQGDVKKDIEISEDEFNPFKFIHLVLDFVVIILFILNIFDLNIQDETNEQVERPINLNFYLGNDPSQE